MELADILLLVKAGYTRDEIAQMDTHSTATPNPESVPKPVPTPSENITQEEQSAQVVESVTTTTSTPVQEQAQPSMSDIMQSIAKLTSAVQANAIAQSVIPQGLQNTPKAEDMIAEIIRPTFKERS